MASYPFSPSLEELPTEVLARILGLLDPRQLSLAEAACRRLRSVVVGHELWLAHCLRAHPAVADAAAAIDASAVPLHRPAGGPAGLAAAQPAGAPGGTPLPGLPSSHAVRRSAFFKRLHFRLGASAARESLIALALGASTTDHPQETVANVLDPIARSRHLTCYWSSRGSQDADSGEALLFQLAHPLCLVTELQMRPFRAFFQWGAPIYAPKAVRFRLGGLACFAPDGTPLPRLQLAEAARREPEGGAAQQAAGGDAAGPQQQQQQQWVWESPVYEVASQDVLQHFPIPPTLCVGGCLRVELLGKRQRQAADDAYYACVCYLRAVGTPVYNFHLRALPAAPGAAAAEQQPQPQQQPGDLHGGGSSTAAAGGDGAQWQLVYCSPDPLLEAGGLVAASEGGRLLRHAAAGQPPLPAEDASDTDSEDEDMLDAAGGDLDALGAVGFGPAAPAVIPWGGPPVVAPEAGGGAAGSSTSSGGSSGSDAEGSDGSGGSSSGSEGGSSGSTEDSDEDDEYFPGGDAGAY